MKRNFRSVLTVILAVCLLAGMVPTVLMPALASETTTTVYDVNGTDFDMTLNSTIVQAKPITNGSAPAGYTGSVVGRSVGNDNVALAVNFGKPIYLSAITSVKVRMYVEAPADGNEAGSELRILGATHTTNASYGHSAYADLGGVTGQWCEIDITNLLNTKVDKEANGTIASFAVSFRNKTSTNRAIYYDSVIVESAGEFLMDSNTYDFNGTDFDTDLINSGVPIAATLIADTSAVPSGFTGAVMGGSKGAKNQVSVSVDFPYMIDPSKVISIKVRMYAANASDGSDSNLRTYVGDGNSTNNADLNYNSVSGGFGQWADIDITQYVTAAKALTTEGYLDNFTIAFRDRATATDRMVYYDSIIIESTGDVFVRPETTGDVYDFNGTDFDTTEKILSSTLSSLSRYSSKLTDTSTVPAGFTGGVYAGKASTYMAVRVNFGYDKLDLTKISSIRVRMYVESNTYAPKFRIFGNTADYYEDTSSTTPELTTDIFGQWYEYELLTALSSSKVKKRADGTISEFIISLRTDKTPMVYFDSLIIEGEEGYYVEAPTPVTTTITPTGLLQSASGSEKSDWRFWIKPKLTFPAGETYYGKGVVPVAIYDKDDNLLISSGSGVTATYYIADGYLMPYITGSYTNKKEPNEGDYVVFTKGTYSGESTPHKIVVTDDIKLVYSGGSWTFQQVVSDTTTTFDFNGTDFATMPFNSDLKTYAAVIADTSTVPAGFTGAVMGSSKGTNNHASSVAVNFSLPLDPSVISKITVRMYVTEETGANDYFRFYYGTTDQTQLTASSKKFGTMAGCAYNQWCDVDITSYVLDYAVGTDGYIDRFAIVLRDYGTGERMVYYDSISITYNGDLFVQPTAPTGDVYDFNGTDFSSPNTTFAENLTSTDHFATKVTDTSTVPAGFTGGVYGGTTSKYMAARVDFGDQALDLSKITSIRARIFIDYNPEDPSIRVFGNTGTYAQENLTKTIYDGWYECELLELLNSSAVTKNSDGTISEFVVSLRNGYTPRVFFDSIIIEGENYLVSTAPAPEEVPDEVGGIEDGIFDFDGVAFETPIKTNGNVTSTASFASKLDDTSAVPSGFAGGVYSVTDSSYTASWVDFNGYIDLSKVTSLRIRIYVPTYTVNEGATAKIRVFGTGGQYVEEVYASGHDQWVEVELLNILKNSKIDKRTDGKLDKFLFSIRTYGNATAYFDKIIIEGTDYYTPVDPSTFITVNTLTLNETSSNKNVNQSYWTVYLGTDLASLPGTPWETVYTDVPVIVNDNTELTMVLKNGGGNNLFLGDLKFTMVASETTYAKITVKAGEYYEQNGDGGLILTNDYTFYIYNDDLWRDPPPADFVVDITFEKMSDVSKINGANWNMYVAPYGAVSVIGKSWTTKWADLVYEVDGVAYTAEMQRAEPKNGMFFQIPGTNLSPATESATVVIKAGTYACTTGDAPSVRVTEDYTFYVVNGAVYSEFDFDNPKFTETVIVDADGGSYTVTDAETVTIDGVTYNQGDVYTTIGTHTLVYSKYNREYTRKVIIYRVGEVGDTAEIDVCDVVMLQRYLSHQTALSESAMLGADLNNDGEVNAGDMLLLRHKLLLIEGLMVLAPADGVTAMGPSEQVEALVTDYDPYALKGNELQNGTEQFHRDPLLLRWTATEDFASYQVHVATKADFSDEMVHTTTSTEYVLVNLLPATTYYWKVTAGGFATETRSFVTEDTIRTLTIGGVDNARDIGGYATGENTRLKYGMVYRTATLDTITEDGLYQMLTVLGIKTELDVRTPGEGTAGASLLGNTINYINYSGPYYYNTTSGILAAAYQDALRAEIRAFADEDNYPIVVHCSVGRDRTGTILFLIEGLCGVSKTDLYMEYELSFLGRIGGNGANVTHLMNEVDKMYNGIQTYAPDGTFAEACEAFMLSVGITQAEIDTIRELMTEVIGEEEPTDPEQPDPNDPNTDFDPDEDETEIF